MSKHDSWVELHSDCGYADILHLFPQGIPTRDPFPMESGKKSSGETAALWIIDAQRLTAEQEKAICNSTAVECGVEAELVKKQAEEVGGYVLNHIYVKSLFGNAENYRRTIEFLDFEASAQGVTSLGWKNFYEQQHRDWIDGDRVPEPMPEYFEDVDPRLQTPKLERAYLDHKLKLAWAKCLR